MSDEIVSEVLVAFAGLIDFRVEVLEPHRQLGPVQAWRHTRAWGQQTCVGPPAARAGQWREIPYDVATDLFRLLWRCGTFPWSLFIMICADRSKRR